MQTYSLLQKILNLAIYYEKESMKYLQRMAQKKKSLKDTLMLCRIAKISFGQQLLYKYCRLCQWVFLVSHMGHTTRIINNIVVDLIINDSSTETSTIKCDIHWANSHPNIHIANPGNHCSVLFESIYNKSLCHPTFKISSKNQKESRNVEIHTNLNTSIYFYSTKIYNIYIRIIA